MNSMYFTRSIIRSITLFFIFATACLADSPKELNEYISLEDNTFGWKIVERNDSAAQKTFLCELTSQKWHDITWKHNLYIVEPSKLIHPKNCILFIGGGRTGRELKLEEKLIATMLAETSGMCVAAVTHVPNQPLLGDYVEDALIGETLLKAIETNDATWPLLFPMAKSAIRAMDAVQEFAKENLGREIDGFIVAGASKRGWTSWMAAASEDKRIIAIAPIVINTLNMALQMKNQLESWGEFSLSIHDYTDRNLVQQLVEKADSADTPEFLVRLWKMIDPFSYRGKILIPKLLINGTNDPYWAVDATKFYWSELVGKKYILTLPNVGHGLDAERIKAFQTLCVFAKYACSGNPWPDFTWQQKEDGDFYEVAINNVPHKEILLWTAKSDSKDFRKARWDGKPIDTYTAKIPKPESGHVAFFLEVKSDYEGIPFSLTTEVWSF